MQDGIIRNGHLPKRLRDYDRLLKKEAAQDIECLQALRKVLIQDCFLPSCLAESYQSDLFPDEKLPYLLNQIETNDFGRMVVRYLQSASFDTPPASKIGKLEACVAAALKDHLIGIAQMIEAGCGKDARLIMERCERIKWELLRDGQIVKQLCQTGAISKKIEKYKQDIDDHIPGAAR